MEQLTDVLSRTLPALAPANGASTTVPALNGPDGRRPKTLLDLVERFQEQEALENADVVLPTSALRTSDGSTLMVPKFGTFGFTDWSRRQCAQLLGVRWDRWFENARPQERADELNRRFARASGSVRVRTTREGADGSADGTLRAFVSPGYSAVADSMIAGILASVLATVDPERILVRAAISDRSVSYVVKVGEKFRPGDDYEVGDLWGGLLVRNSGVGFASLLVVLHLTRLICKNGMTAPLPDAVLVKRRHRALDEHALREILAEKLERLPERIARSADVLRRSGERAVRNVEDALVSFLDGANLPRRHLQALTTAYAAEPSPTAFGIAQAATRAAQGMNPEVRFDLERAAGAYLAQA